jgi:hypothetical protein
MGRNDFPVVGPSFLPKIFVRRADMETTYTFISSKEGGWLRVDRKGPTSPDSKLGGAFEYLNEDREASQFLRAVEAAGCKLTIRSIPLSDESQVDLKKTTFTPHSSFKGQGWVKVPFRYLYPDVFLCDIGLEKYQVYGFSFMDGGCYRVDLDRLLKAADENEWEVEILPEYTPE